MEDLVKALRDLGLAAAGPLPKKIPEEIQRLVSEQVAAQDVAHWLESDASVLDRTGTLRALYVLLCGDSGLSIRNRNDGVADEYCKTLQEITESVGKITLPVLKIQPHGQDNTDYDSLRAQGELGLDILNTLLTKHGAKPDTATLLTIAAFSNSDDGWTTTSSAALARGLLDKHFGDRDEEQRARFITEDVLTGFLRPLFSKSRPATVTASGRKAEFVEPTRYDGGDDAEARKPWKYERRYAVSVFEWAVEHSDKALLEKHWHLFTPVLLTLLDEGDAAIRVRGLGALRRFWARCPTDLMRRTGLAQVIEDAVFPAVLYLPSLTPEAEAVAVLGAAYPALMAMAGIDPDAEDRGDESRAFTQEQRKLLDRIIREGILVGYHHASEYMRVVELLCEQLRRLVDGMGILAIKHLKNLIAMTCAILAEPFGTTHPPMLQSAIAVLQALLRTCWPRVPHYCNDIVRGLMLCWLNVEEEYEEEGSFPAAELKAELVKAADMLAAVMQAVDDNMDERVATLVKAEPGLLELFRPAKSRDS